MTNTIILGGGMTGLAAGMASGLPVLEAADASGGICSSYYLCPGTTDRLATAPHHGEAYRFEIGGGHWIFGGDPAILHLIRTLTPVKSYQRRSSVYFCQGDRYVPYPLTKSPELSAGVSQPSLTGDHPSQDRFCHSARLAASILWGHPL
jgi:protoporphyrinogen oxidase